MLPVVIVRNFGKRLVRAQVGDTHQDVCNSPLPQRRGEIGIFAQWKANTPQNFEHFVYSFFGTHGNSDICSIFGFLAFLIS
jgi:hypothetical protein